MFSHRSGERVLNGNNRDCGETALQTIKHFPRPGARDDFAAGDHTFGRFVAETSRLALDRDFHAQYSSERRSGKQLRSKLLAQHKRIDTIGVIARFGPENKVLMPLVERNGSLVIDRGLKEDPLTAFRSKAMFG